VIGSKTGNERGGGGFVWTLEPSTFPLSLLWARSATRHRLYAVEGHVRLLLGVLQVELYGVLRLCRGSLRSPLLSLWPEVLWSFFGSASRYVLEYWFLYFVCGFLLVLLQFGWSDTGSPVREGPFLGLSVRGSLGLLWLPPVRLGGYLNELIVTFCAQHEISCCNILFVKLGAPCYCWLLHVIIFVMERITCY
jgi:hypothetical protein